MLRVLRPLLAAALVFVPTHAHADGFLSPWVGWAFGSGVGITDGVPPLTTDDGQTLVGISAGGMSKGIIGAEVDFGYGRSFFGDTTLYGDNAVTTLMADVIVGVPIGGSHGAGIRPYVTGGLGLLHSHVAGGRLSVPAPSSDGLGWNVGGGMIGYFSKHVGARADLRYFRSINEMDIGFFLGSRDRDTFNTLQLWRASVGVILR